LLYFLFAAFGIWLIVYLNLPPIRQAFTRSSYTCLIPLHIPRPHSHS